MENIGGTIKRRSTEAWNAAQSNLPSMPAMPSMPALPSLPPLPVMRQFTLDAFRRQPNQEGMRGTWERIDLPPVPRSSHSLDIVSGCAYIFGGEVTPREPVDNDMLVIRLPFSSAGADYFKIKAKPDTTIPTPTSIQDKGKKGKLDDAAVDVAESPKAKAKAEDLGEEVGEEEEESDSGESRNTEQTDETKSDTKPASVDKGKGRATQDLGDVPPPRIGHATAVIGSRIFVFGGYAGPDMRPLDENGRVWIFDTRTRLWTYLDPVPAVKGGSIIPHPAPRSYHCATATDRPRDFAPPPPTQAQSWQEWALGDTSKTGIPQDPIVGHVAENASDEETDGYGTFFVHAGINTSGDRTSDLWAFDVHSRTWTELPAAPGPSRSGTSICISKSRIFRFGGFDGQREIGGQVDFLNLEVEMFDDRVTRGEVSVRARGGWQSIYENAPEASSKEFSSENIQAWPGPRSVSSLEAITIGGGTEYLVLTMGEATSSSESHTGIGKSHNDVWLFQVPPVGMTAASFTAAMLQAVGRKTGEGKWTKVTMGPYDEEVLEMPRGRGWLASAPMSDLEETGIVIWGGLDDNNRRRGEGWILRLV
ncbi:hypothetical protein TASIC1_0007039500 [Trichoderma asperellum]|uniref:Nitrile-specifier protein 5 n=1 Tax=Trichoderma asperellum TaxID=101201 RepID=A0A6V8R2S5_TRIAP|nr:hypothetical protein TASIC1_0007039500 [Trichoderma asperellum]